MTANPVDLITGLTTTANVVKGDMTAWAKARVPQVMANATEIRNTTLVGQVAVELQATGMTYYLDAADTTTADDGVTCIVSSDGKRFKLRPGTFVLDTDGTLAANSDARVASQKAVKTYADTKVSGPGSSTNGGFAKFNGTTGKILQDHAATIDLTSEVSGALPAANGGTGNNGGAWTAWAPTVTPQGGAFTTISAAGAYCVIGKLVLFHLTITCTAKGTATGAMSVPLPVGTAKRAASVSATETALMGFMGYGRIAASGSAISGITKYDNTAYFDNGSVTTLSGFYEQT